MKNYDKNHLFNIFDVLHFQDLSQVSQILTAEDYFPALQNTTRFLVDCLTDILFNFGMNILFLCLVKKVSAFILECKDFECCKVMDLSRDCDNVLINLVSILCLNYFSYFVKDYLA